MKKRLIIMLLSVIISKAYAQNQPTKSTSQNEDPVGIWTLVAVENFNPDGSKTLPYGNSPQGLLILDKNGVYAIQILKAIRPKVVAGDKNKATPEENVAMVQGNNSHFGSYTTDLLKETITFNVEHAFYPNWEGTVQERFYTLKNDELKYIVTNTTNGGAITASVTWKRKVN
ncbi:MAG: lipocalin-like domain-containing protein [Dyadobacter sp.]